MKTKKTSVLNVRQAPRVRGDGGKILKAQMETHWQVVSADVESERLRKFSFERRRSMEQRSDCFKKLAELTVCKMRTA